MRTEAAVVIALLAVASLAACGDEAPSSQAAAAPDVPAPPPPPEPVVPWAGWSDDFVGSLSCRKCHFKEYVSWKRRTGMAQAVESLRPTSQTRPELRRRKSAAGLDPDHDYSADPACLPCHTTGYGAPGGYPLPGGDVPDTRVDGVGCECCHGPGGRYVAYKNAWLDAWLDAGEKPNLETLSSLGLVRPDAAVCARCHNASSPTRADPADDPWETARDAGHPRRR